LAEAGRRLARFLILKGKCFRSRKTPLLGRATKQETLEGKNIRKSGKRIDMLRQRKT
jgi:hypothetical protein